MRRILLTFLAVSALAFAGCATTDTADAPPAENAPTGDGSRSPVPDPDMLDNY